MPINSLGLGEALVISKHLAHRTKKGLGPNARMGEILRQRTVAILPRHGGLDRVVVVFQGGASVTESSRVSKYGRRLGREVDLQSPVGSINQPLRVSIYLDPMSITFRMNIWDPSSLFVSSLTFRRCWVVALRTEG